MKESLKTPNNQWLYKSASNVLCILLLVDFGSEVNSTDSINFALPLTFLTEESEELQSLAEALLPGFLSLLESEKIPASDDVINNHSKLFIPFCNWLVKQKQKKPLIIGINGSQGSGKSTLTKILKHILEQGFNKNVVSLSIDDLYKTKVERQQLAEEIHPLFITRGVPGTHDVNLGLSVLNHLLEDNTSELAIPCFDKAIDDRLPESQWPKFKGKCDIVLFEGWCVGSIAEHEDSLATPVNTFEQFEDDNAIWRRFVNQQLKTKYTELFALIDLQILLKIPDFNKVFEWRKLQESKLQDNITDTKNSVMNEKEINRFIMHFERITKHTLSEMPDRCNIVFEINDNHQINNVTARCDQ